MRTNLAGRSWQTVIPSMLLVGLLATSTAVAQETRYNVTLFQNFSSSAMAVFTQSGSTESMGLVQLGELQVSLTESDPDMDPPSDSGDPVPPDGMVKEAGSELAGNWIQLDLWWFPIWFGAAESGSGEMFAFGLQVNDQLIGRALLFGELVSPPGRYVFRGEMTGMASQDDSPAEDSTADSDSAAIDGGSSR